VTVAVPEFGSLFPIRVFDKRLRTQCNINLRTDAPLIGCGDDAVSVSLERPGLNNRMSRVDIALERDDCFVCLVANVVLLIVVNCV
jgi:hypothetical protein